MTTAVQVTFDCADPGSLATFWAKVLGYVVQPPPEGFATWEEALAAFGVPEQEWNSRSAIVDPDGPGPRLFFQRVPEGKTAKNRLHLDVRAGGGLEGDDRRERIRNEADRLVFLGARLLRINEPEDPLDQFYIVMADPEDNEFCLD